MNLPYLRRQGKRLQQMRKFLKRSLPLHWRRRF